jgi:signal transduction histidine kinase/ActR/RegA family two-component response regulator
MAPPSPQPRPRLVALLRDRREELIRRWTQRVVEDPRVPDASRLSEPELRDHVPELLDRIADDVEACEAGAPRPLGAGESARKHARQRAAEGYGLVEALRELSHFRAVLLGLCAEERVPLEDGTAEVLHRAIDESMTHGADEMERMALDRGKAAGTERDQLLASERTARSEAERAAHLRDEFVATVSHELRTPLNAILGWASMLRSGKLDAGATAKALEVIERNAKAQATLVEDLLDISRIGSGKLRLDVRQVNLAAILENAVASHMPEAQAKGLHLDKRLDDCTCSVVGDPGRIEQIASNLLSNAIKFTPAGGRVAVSCQRVRSRIEVVVEDTGKGIDAEFLPCVFDRFRQAEASLTRQHRGLGLGLTLVKFLVEQHGGQIRADSDGAGRGAKFTVTLPIAAALKTGEPPSPIEACGALAGLKALVVDDEEDARTLLRRILEDCRAEVTLAGSAAEALAELPRLRPDVLISDIGMPELDGYQLIRAARALGPEEGGATPAIALTAFARPEDRLRAIEAGYQMHIAKPVDPSELLLVIADVTGRLPKPREQDVAAEE